MNALLVDDSTTIRHLVKRMLEESFPGCVVSEAAEGRAAIRALTQQRIDLIVTDLEMPGMDGRRFLSTLQGNPLLKKKSVVVLSSAISEEMKAALSGAENVVLLPKPASSRAIKEAVEKALAMNPIGGN
jgi:CheY-like chemotaxis protein